MNDNMGYRVKRYRVESRTNPKNVCFNRIDLNNLGPIEELPTQVRMPFPCRQRRNERFENHAPKYAHIAPGLEEIIDAFEARLHVAAGHEKNGRSRGWDGPDEEKQARRPPDDGVAWIFDCMRKVERYDSGRAEICWYPAQMRDQNLRKLQKLAAEALLNMRIEASRRPDSAEFDPERAREFDEELTNLAIFFGSEHAKYTVARFFWRCNQPEYARRLANLGAENTVDLEDHIRLLRKIDTVPRTDWHRFADRIVRRIEHQCRHGTGADKRQAFDPLEDTQAELEQEVLEKKYPYALELWE